MKTVVHTSPEPLECRIAPATLYAVTSTNHLLEFDSTSPDTIARDLAITGIGGETIIGMDFRPASGQLYFVTKQGITGRLYTLNTDTAAAVLIATLAADPTDISSPYTGLAGTNFGVDFNPMADRLRIVSDTEQNLRVNVATGLVTTDGDLTPGSPDVVASAYLNSFAGTTATTLYGIDATTDELFIQNPPNTGTLVFVGSLGVNADATVGFDIAPKGNQALAALRVGGATQLHTIDLTNGAATMVGAIGDGTASLLGFAVQPVDVKLVNAKTATYTDEDGDLVTVTVSKGTLNRGDLLLRPTNGTGGGQLTMLLLSDDAGDFDQANVSITSKAAGGGDGLVRVGLIQSALNDLGTVLVDGDLGRIIAGDLTTTDAAVKSLTVQSLGRSGTATQIPATTGTGSLQTSLTGPVGGIAVKTDIFEAAIDITGGTAGTLGSLTVGGSMIGGAGTGSGSIFASGNIGPVKIGQDLRGGGGSFSGSVESTAKLGDVTVSGSVVGGGTVSGRIVGADGIGAVKIGRNLTGGAEGSGVIYTTNGGIKSLTISGSVLGGLDGSAFVDAFDIGPVLIKGDLAGSTGIDTAAIIGNKLGPVTVLGSVVGGSGETSGSVRATTSIASLKIGGDLRGGVGNGSGLIIAKSIGAVSIGLSMIGGAGEESGSLDIDGPIASVKVGGDVRGGAGMESAYIHALGTLGPVTIKGSLVGGAGPQSAIVYSGNAIAIANVMKGVSVGGSLIGGTGMGSGSIGAVNGAVGNPSNVDIGPVIIKGSVIGGGITTASITGNHIASILIGGSVIGGGSSQSGYISASAELKSLTIGGSVFGGGVTTAGFIVAEKLGTAKIAGDLRGGAGDFSGHLSVNLGGAKSITVGGDVVSGAGNFSGSIAVNSVLGSLTIGGDVLGTSTDPVFLSARGADGTMALAMGKVAIKGSVTFAQILGGHLLGLVQNADANLGPITIGGDFIASSIAAGVNTGGNGVNLSGSDGFFGTPDDIASTVNHTLGNTSRIASVIIKGQALGTVGGVDAFGIVAREIKVLKIAGGTYPALNATTQGPVSLGVTGDFVARTDV